MMMYSQRPTESYSYASYLRVFYAVGLLMVGVLYPEDKTSLAGLHWPPFVALVGLVMIIALKQKLADGLGLIAWMIGWMSLFIFSSLIFITAGLHEPPTLTFVLKQYLTLLVTSGLSFLLVSDLPVRLILLGIYRFMLCLALALIVVRLSLFDYTREGTFLGLGPLTFSRYICIGWIAQIAYDKRLRLLPALIFMLPLAVADSKGPTLFLVLTIVIWELIRSSKNWAFIALVAVISILIGFSSERFEALVSDLSAISTENVVLPDAEEFEYLAEQEAISSTLARIVAIESTIKLISERPLIGWGIGNWPKTTGLYYLEYPHNSILEIWFEYGIFGALIFLTLACRSAIAVRHGNPFSLIVIFCALVSLTTGSIRDLRTLCFFMLLTFHFMAVGKDQPGVENASANRNQSLNA